ncbi:MAG: TetR/AcrR family transcriptional regulator [Spirochaetes bacterium]|nr:TetR/AcrR family transcriptional regulator [Spirochaetota bacterium]
MRKKRDAEGTKFKILKCAEKLFADKGFNGTSIAMISKASSLSDGLILYHFKSKENLYKLVIERISAHYLEVVTGPLEKETSIEEAMKTSLIGAFNFWKNDKTCQRLNLWAYLENKEDKSANEARLVEKLAAYFKSLQGKGIFSADIHPVVFLTMIIGSIQFWFRYKKHFLKILNLKQTGDEFDNMFLNQFALMLQSIIYNKTEK